MRAIDTNVVVRFLIADDRAQADRAHAAILAGDIFIPTTVFLESEWVLRSAYRLAPIEISDAFRSLAGLPGVNVEDPALLARALDAVATGFDFADALHLGKADGCSAFLTFDRQLAKRAHRYPEMSVAEP